MTNYIQNNYMKGCISGMTGILLSHPLDSIKTHKQTSTNVFKYNIPNLYRGITSPLIGVGIEKALVFGTYNYCKSQNLNIPLSGAISGLVAAIVVSPYERIKILRQTNQSISLKMIMSPSFMFKGIGTTFTREVPGFAIYFATYEKLKTYFFTSKNKEINLPSSFIFGGLSGTMAWIFIYPQDRIKTIVQNEMKSTNIYQLIKSIYNAGGLMHFYKGFSFAVGRAILLHSGTFCTMEILNKI